MNANNVKLIALIAGSVSALGLVIGGSIAGVKLKKKHDKIEAEKEALREQERRRKEELVDKINNKITLLDLKTKQYFDEKTKNIPYAMNVVVDAANKFDFEAGDMTALVSIGRNLRPFYMSPSLSISAVDLVYMLGKEDFDLDTHLNNYKNDLDEQIEEYKRFIENLKEEKACKCLIEQHSLQMKELEEQSKHNREVEIKKLEREIAEAPLKIEKEKAIELAKIDQEKEIKLAKIDQENKKKTNDTLKDIASDIINKKD